MVADKRLIVSYRPRHELELHCLMKQSRWQPIIALLVFRCFERVSPIVTSKNVNISSFALLFYFVCRFCLSFDFPYYVGRVAVTVIILSFRMLNVLSPTSPTLPPFHVSNCTGLDCSLSIVPCYIHSFTPYL